MNINDHIKTFIIYFRIKIVDFFAMIVNKKKKKIDDSIRWNPEDLTMWLPCQISPPTT